MYTVLIADDEQVIRSGLQKYILWNQIGFTCTGTVSNGREAIEAITQQHPDVVLCDIRMPIVSGLDVARYVFENKLPTIVVLNSAYRDFEYARTAMAYGVRYYVVKSARHSELIDTFTQIKNELDQRQNQPENDDQLLFQIKQYIGRNLQTVTLESAAAFVGRHPSSVSQYFRQQSGMLFSQYLTQERMRYAARLLCDMRVRVNDVSERVGYSSSQNFTRSFRQFYGVTPREYRMTHVPGQEDCDDE